MDDRAQTFDLDRDHPAITLFRRIARVMAVPAIVVGVLELIAIGFNWNIVVGFVPSVLFEVVADLLRRVSPRQVSIDSTGLAFLGPGPQLKCAWSDIKSVEVMGSNDYPVKWLLRLLRIDRSRDFVNVGLRPRMPRHYKRLTIFMSEPERFVDAARELRPQSVRSPV